MKISSHVREGFASLIAYLGVAFLYLLPLPLHWGTHIPGDNGDSVPNLWPFWYFPNALADGATSLFRTTLQFFPDGINEIYASNSALGAIIMGPLSIFWSPAAALNTWLVLHIWLGGWFFYRFCRLIGAQPWGAWLGGFSYACSPFVAVHLPGHYTLVQIAFTSGALYALAALIRWAVDETQESSQGIPAAAGLAISCWAVAVTDFYLGTMTVFLLVVTLAHFTMTYGKALFTSRRLWISLLAAAAGTILMLIPWGIMVIRANEGHDYSAIDPAMGSKNVATWSRLVTFPAYHSVWEPMMFPAYLGKLSIFNEWTYLGMVGFFVAAVGLLYVRPLRRIPWAWIIGFLIALGLAGANSHTLDPAWSGGPLSFGKYWPTIFPFSEFRVPGRWHFVLCVALAVGISIGSSALLYKLRRGPRAIIGTVLFMLMAFDLMRWPLPLCEAQPLSTGIENVDKNSGTVLDVPVGIISGQGHSLGIYEKETLLRQMDHGRPILTANVSRLPNDVIQRRRDDPELSAFLAVQAGDAVSSSMLALDWMGFRRDYNITSVRIPVDWPTSAGIIRLMNQAKAGWLPQTDGSAIIMQFP